MGRRKKTSLDKKDKQIITALLLEPHLTLEELVERVPLGISSIKTRVATLQALGFLSRGWIVSASNPVFPYQVVVILQINGADFPYESLSNNQTILRQKLKKDSKVGLFIGKISIVGVYQMIGSADRIVQLRAQEPEIARNFINQNIRTIKGVTSATMMLSTLWPKNNS